MLCKNGNGISKDVARGGSTAASNMCRMARHRRKRDMHGLRTSHQKRNDFSSVLCLVDLVASASNNIEAAVNCHTRA